MRLPLISRVSYSGMGFISTGKRIGYRFSAVNTTDSRKPDKQTGFAQRKKSSGNVIARACYPPLNTATTIQSDRDQ